MKRRTFLLKLYPERQERTLSALKALGPEIQKAAARLGVHNFSIWSVSNLLCGYGEYESDIDLDAAPELRAACRMAEIGGRAAHIMDISLEFLPVRQFLRLPENGFLAPRLDDPAP